MKKLCLFLLPTVAMPFLVNCGGNGYRVYSETSRLVITPSSTTKGTDYVGTISLKKEGKNILPLSLDSVILDDNNKTDITDKCVYQVNNDNLNAYIKIPKENITADIKITMTLKNLSTAKWYDYINWWDYCSNAGTQQATIDDVGKEVDLIVNNQIHKIRLIDIDHDDLADGSGKAHCTFEFANLLSDKDGYSLATVWDWGKGSDSTNYDYLNSNLRKVFDGGGSGEIVWYRKDENTSEQTQKTEYANKTVLDMIPGSSNPQKPGLKEVLKEIKKPVTINEKYKWKVTSYNTKLFPLSFREATESSSYYAEDEGLTYAFYKGKGDVDINRIKHQVKWHDGATLDDKVNITDGKCSNSLNFAGYNYRTTAYGSYFWLRSSRTGSDNLAWIIYHDGATVHASSRTRAFAIVPAFCI